MFWRSPLTALHTLWLLHDAARQGNLSRVRELILDGAATSAQPHSAGRTPLHEAALWGHLNVVQYLLQETDMIHAVNVVDVDTTPSTTPLMEAAVGGHVDVVRYLVEMAHADVTAVDSAGRTVLHKAAARGHLQVCQYLVEHVMNNKQQPQNQQQYAWPVDKYGRTPLHEAASHLNVLRYLVEQCDSDEDDNGTKNARARTVTGDTVLHYAVAQGAANVVEWLCQRDASLLHIPNNQQKTPYDVALTAVKDPTVERNVVLDILESYGADSTGDSHEATTTTLEDGNFQYDSSTAGQVANGGRRDEYKQATLRYNTILQKDRRRQRQQAVVGLDKRMTSPPLPDLTATAIQGTQQTREFYNTHRDFAQQLEAARQRAVQKQSEQTTTMTLEPSSPVPVPPPSSSYSIKVRLGRLEKALGMTTTTTSNSAVPKSILDRLVAIEQTLLGPLSAKIDGVAVLDRLVDLESELLDENTNRNAPTPSSSSSSSSSSLKTRLHLLNQQMGFTENNSPQASIMDQLKNLELQLWGKSSKEVAAVVPRLLKLEQVLLNGSSSPSLKSRVHRLEQELGVKNAPKGTFVSNDLDMLELLVWGETKSNNNNNSNSGGENGIMPRLVQLESELLDQGSLDGSSATILGRLTRLERNVQMGSPVQGPILKRMAALETKLWGEAFHGGPVVKRLAQLESDGVPFSRIQQLRRELGLADGTNVAGAVRTSSNRSSSSNISDALEEIEVTLFGKACSGTIHKRLSNLESQLMG